MADGRGDAVFATIVESHHAAVGNGQLYLALALLSGHLACHRAVHLVGEPVLAGYGLELKNTLKVFLDGSGHVASQAIGYGGIVPFHRIVAHDRLWRMAEHLCHIEVKRLHTVALPEREVCIARGLADYIHRGTLALCYLAHVLNVFLVDEQAHTLLALVGNNLFRRERLVADRQLCHVNLAAALLYQF